MADTITRTNIRIISGVPFNVDYKHTRWFTSKTAQSNYFQALPYVYADNMANFQRIEGRFRYRCPLNIEDMNGVNYMYFSNETGEQKRYYAFVTHKEYVNKNTTDVYFELDVLQTFMFDMEFKDSYVVREHRPLYYSNGSTPYINTQPEGLHYGEEYDIKKVSQIVNDYDVRFFVIISKTPLHDPGDGSQASYIVSPQPLSYYFIPFTPDGNSCPVAIDGRDNPTSTPDGLMDSLYSSESNVNNIVSFYVTEDIGIPFDVQKASGSQPVVHFNLTGMKGEHSLKNVGIGDSNVTEQYAVFVEKVTEFNPTEFTVSFSKWLDMSNLKTPRESKLLMSPYHVIEINDFKGNVVTYRPEYIEDGDKVTIVRQGSLGLSNKVSYAIKNYNQKNSDTGAGNILDLQNALIDNNPQDVTVKNEMLAAFLQGNRNQIQTQQTGAIVNGTLGAMSSMMGVVGGIKAGAQGAVDQATLGGMQGLANTALTIQGIQAKQKDISNIPPSISKMGNNTAFDVGNDLLGVFVLYKGIKKEYEDRLSDFFHMYGYRTNLVKQPNLNTRQHFNYVETIDCVIHGDFENKYLEKIKSIFNSGITLWHTSVVGDYGLYNGVKD